MDDRRTISFVTDAPVVEVVGHGYNDTELPPGFDAERTRVVVLERMREANPGARFWVSPWWQAERDALNPGSLKARAQAKRVARNRARTKAAHRARMAQKGRR